VFEGGVVAQCLVMSFLAPLLGVLLLMGPVALLVAIGIWSLHGRPSGWRTAAAASAAGVVVWGIFVSLYEHETPCGDAPSCPSIFGSPALLGGDDGAGYLILLAGMLAAAALLGATRSTPSVGIGASVVALPSLLAWSTAPRGDNDGLWVLVFWVLAAVGAFAAGAAETARAVVVEVRSRRRSADDDGSSGAR
jgi:hypothetical protein